MFKVLQHSFCSKNYDISGFSLLQKRRMSKMDKILYTCIKGIDEISSIPILFVSNHGEINRCIDLLSELSKDNVVSPTSFCKSVLNASISTICIQNQNNSEILAISSDYPSETGFLSAFCKFKRYDKILILIYEEQIGEVACGASFLVQKGDEFSIRNLNKKRLKLDLAEVYDKFITKADFNNGKFEWQFN